MLLLVEVAFFPFFFSFLFLSFFFFFPTAPFEKLPLLLDLHMHQVSLQAAVGIHASFHGNSRRIIIS